MSHLGPQRIFRALSGQYFDLVIITGMSGAFFVVSFACLSVFLVSFFRRRTGAN